MDKKLLFYPCQCIYTCSPKGKSISMGSAKDKKLIEYKIVHSSVSTWRL